MGSNGHDTKIEDAIIFDFDGVICKSGLKTMALSAEVLENHFAQYGIFGQTAKDIAYDLYYIGGNIEKIIQERVPNVKSRDITLVVKDFYKRAKAEIYDTSSISAIARSLVKNLYLDPKNRIYVSSLGREDLMNDFLERHKMRTWFAKVYGQESGKKDQHIKEIKKANPNAKTIFITDGAYDAKCDVDIVLGLVNDDNQRIKNIFAECSAGKVCHLFNSMHGVYSFFKQNNFVQ